MSSIKGIIFDFGGTAFLTAAGKQRQEQERGKFLQNIFHIAASA